MKGCLFAVALVFGSLLAGCGGGGASGPIEQLPAASAPRNVIAFGATDAAGANALYSIAPDGIHILQLSAEPAAVSFPRWSPSGDRIAYIVGATGAQATLRVYSFATSAASTVSSHVLASAEGPTTAWSPDGSRIAFIESTDGGHVRVFDFKQNKVRDTPDDAATAVDWSRRDELAIVAPAGESTRVYTMGADGKGKHQLPGGDKVNGAPAWSIDGKTLAFWGGSSLQLSQRSVFVYATSSAQTKTIGPGTNASWSNDGRLAFSRSVNAGASGALDIYATGVGGVSPARLTQSITQIRWPSWSPDAKSIVYLSAADPSTTFLCTVIVAETKNECLDLTGLRPGVPAWSPF